MPSDFDSPRNARSRGPSSDYVEGSNAADDYDVRKPRGKDAAQPKSILREPSAGAAKRRPRSNSQVRIRPASPDNDSDGSIDGRYVRHRDGRVEFVPEGGGSGRSSRRPIDLEKKTGSRNKDFRDKRDGYESDEGEMLKGAKRYNPRPSRRAHPDDDVSYGGRDVDLPHRPKDQGRRRPSPDDYEVAGAGAGVAGTAAARSRGDNRDPYSSGRGRYDDDDRRRPARPRSDRYDGRGYESDHKPPKSSRYDRDDRRPDPYRSDGRRRADASAPRARYGDDAYDRRDDRRPLQRSRSERVPDGKHRERDRHGKDERGGGGNQDWKKQAGTMFMTTAMPVIRREGTKFVKKELENYMKNKAGGR